MGIEYQNQGLGVKRGRICFVPLLRNIMPFKFCAIVLLILSACGPDWVDCNTCKPGEPSAESVDGGQQIPVVVNVDVDVTVTNNTNTTTVNQPGPDAGTRICRTVCTCYEERQHCDRGWHGTSHKGRCNPKPKFKKCVKEVVQCS
jgi:hypothetical protein